MAAWVQAGSVFGRVARALLGRAIHREADAEGDGQGDIDRVHIFAGNFADEAAMFAYCFTPVGRNGPEQLNLDLPEAPIDTDQIEAAFDDQILPRLAEYFGKPARRRILDRMQGANAVVLIPTRAFGGQPFRLHDTPRLRLVASETSLVPAVSELGP